MKTKKSVIIEDKKYDTQVCSFHLGDYSLSLIENKEAKNIRIINHKGKVLKRYKNKQLALALDMFKDYCERAI